MVLGQDSSRSTLGAACFDEGSCTCAAHTAFTVNRHPAPGTFSGYEYKSLVDYQLFAASGDVVSPPSVNGPALWQPGLQICDVYITAREVHPTQLQLTSLTIRSARSRARQVLKYSATRQTKNTTRG